MRLEKIEELKGYINELRTIKMELVDRKSKFLNVESYDCYLSNGRVIPREKIIKGKSSGNACVILPITDNKNVLLVVQPRVFTESSVGVELPAGYVNDGEDYEEAARRLGVLTEECLFVGDGGSNELFGAKDAGIKPVQAKWYTNKYPKKRENIGNFLRAEEPMDIMNIILKRGQL